MYDVTVIGGGLGGLAAASMAAGRGRRVLVLERAGALGGRGTSRSRGGFVWNLGGHALYRRGEAARVLASLGVSFAGGVPGTDGLALLDGRTHTLPAGPMSLLLTGLLGVRGKIELGRLLARLGKLDVASLAAVSLRDWLTGFHDPRARDVLAMLVRVTSYANAPDVMSAGAAIEQLRLANEGGVLYLDGGWQTLVDGLTSRAIERGVRLEPGADVRRVEPAEGGFRVKTEDGREFVSGAVVLAVPPRVAAALVPGAAGQTLARWATDAIPARAACLDVALRRLPRPQARFALGVEEPVYYSVHSATCKLAPEGGAVIHMMTYLAPAQGGEEAALRRWLDHLQPGWGKVCEDQRFLPGMVATHAVPRADRGGLAGRPGPVVPGVHGLFVVGDWVGPRGMLLDASLASARDADLALAEHEGRRAREVPPAALTGT